MGQSKSQVIGIDLGTTFCAMAYLDRGGVPVTISSSEGELTTPSVVLFDPDGVGAVGRHALRACQVYPGNVAVCTKREMGDTYCRKLIAGRKMSPVHISSLILKKLKQDAEKKIGSIAGAVITVPAYFDETRRQATVDAGTIAGLNVLDILNEPTAAALARGFVGYLERGGDAHDLENAARFSQKSEVTLVYDLGGGTFDVSLIRIKGEEFRVLATEGDVRLGGKDWDDRILTHAVDLFVKEHETNPLSDPLSHQELVLAAEEAKKDLSSLSSTAFTVNHGGNRLVVTLDREQFEEMTSELLFRTENRLCQVIENANLTWEEVDKVLLVGGSTRMPQVTEMLRRITGKEPDGSLSVDEMVAHGAAIHAAMIAVTGKAAGAFPAPKPSPETEHETIPETEIEDEKFISPPSSADKEQFVEAGAAPQESVTTNPDKPLDVTSQNFVSVAFNYDQDVTDALADIKTVNVNSHSLGVVAQSPHTGKKRVTFLIPKNSSLPTSHKKVFGTVKKDQDFVKVRVVEGESKHPEACITIGECIVAPLAKGLPKGAPISVTFTYDNSGRLYVEAVDDTSGSKAHTVIVRNLAMSEEKLADARKLVDEIVIP